VTKRVTLLSLAGPILLALGACTANFNIALPPSLAQPASRPSRPIGYIDANTPIGTVLLFGIPTESDGDDVFRGDLKVIKIGQKDGQLFVWFQHAGKPVPMTGEGYPVDYWNAEFGLSPTGRKEPASQSAMEK
jgi:hypothetical protein